MANLTLKLVNNFCTWSLKKLFQSSQSCDEITPFKCAVMKQPSFTARGDKFKDKRFK